MIQVSVLSVKHSPVIKLVNVWKSYGKTCVLKEISLNVYEKDFVIIRGKSGVGKTTLLKIIGLLLKPCKGEVWINGVNTLNLSDKELSMLRLKTIGFIFQSFNLIPTLNTLENIALPLILQGFSKREAFEKSYSLLREFNMTNLSRKYPYQLSVGEQQRVAILRAIVKNPKIILADEPTANLDDENTGIVLETLVSHIKYSNSLVIMTTTSAKEKPKNYPTVEYVLRNCMLIKK